MSNYVILYIIGKCLTRQKLPKINGLINNQVKFTTYFHFADTRFPKTCIASLNALQLVILVFHWFEITKMYCQWTIILTSNHHIKCVPTPNINSNLVINKQRELCLLSSISLESNKQCRFQPGKLNLTLRGSNTKKTSISAFNFPNI